MASSSASKRSRALRRPDQNSRSLGSIWSPRFELNFHDDASGAFPHRVLRRDWQDDSIQFGQVAPRSRGGLRR
jgi:hypothetical protein